MKQVLSSVVPTCTLATFRPRNVLHSSKCFEVLGSSLSRLAYRYQQQETPQVQWLLHSLNPTRRPTSRGASLHVFACDPQLTSNLKCRLYSTGELSDLTVTCGDYPCCPASRFKVHKLILGCQSEVLREMMLPSKVCLPAAWPIRTTLLTYSTCN